MKLFEQSTDDQARAIEKEIAAAAGRIEELTAQLADIEQRLGEARNNQKRWTAEAADAIHDAAIAEVSLEEQRPGPQSALAELQLHRQHAEQRLAALHEAAKRTKVSDCLQNVARDLTNTVTDYVTVGERLATILNWAAHWNAGVKDPIAQALAATLSDHCTHIVAPAEKIVLELQRTAGEVRDGSRPLPKDVSPPPAPEPSAQHPTEAAGGDQSPVSLTIP